MYKGTGLKRNSQCGFTLVEIAVVLVIIGLLIGGILQGTELIDNSRVKKAGSDFQSISAAYVSYQDRFQRLPGDDGNLAALQARGGDWAQVTAAGNNNGALAVNNNQAFTGAGENAAFWQHLRAAGYIAGDPSQTGVAALPRNAFSGLTGISTQVALGNMTGVKVCMSQVPGKAAAALDLQFDDGQPDTGDIRSNQGTTGQNTAPNATAATAYSEDNEYSICRRI